MKSKLIAVICLVVMLFSVVACTKNPHLYYPGSRYTNIQVMERVAIENQKLLPAPSRTEGVDQG